jgi:hypothetical protein
VDQLLTVAEIVATNAIVVAPIVGIVLFIRRGVDVEQGVPLRYAEPGWPRGVQEEDPPHWRVELAHQRRRPTARGERSVTPRVTQGCDVAPAR